MKSGYNIAKRMFYHTEWYRKEFIKEFFMYYDVKGLSKKTPYAIKVVLVKLDLLIKNKKWTDVVKENYFNGLNQCHSIDSMNEYNFKKPTKKEYKLIQQFKDSMYGNENYKGKKFEWFLNCKKEFILLHPIMTRYKLIYF